MIVGASIFTLFVVCAYFLWRSKVSSDAAPASSPAFYWDEDALPKALDIVDRINRVAGGRTLTAERARHLSSLGGHCILVYGQLGNLQAGDCGPEWTTRHACFVIAPADSTHDLVGNSSDLDLLFQTPEFSIFTIDDKAARRLP